jgi:small subunit ribosomal protein S18
MARREKKAPAAKDRRPAKKKTSILTSESIDWVDYKDVNLLRRFMSERAKIRARRVTGNSQQQQVAVARAIRVAREMALLPYSVRQVTQRSKGRRDRDRDREAPDETAVLEPEALEGLEGEGLESLEGLEGGEEFEGIEPPASEEGAGVDAEAGEGSGAAR